MELSDQQILEWAHDRSVAKNIAADLATKIGNGALRTWDELPGDIELGDKWETSPRTAGRAKRLLVDSGLVRLSNGRYCVA